MDWWLRTFDKESPYVLAKAIELLTKTCERMPAPGNLTKAISEVRESMPSAMSTQYSYRKTVAPDPETGEMVNAIIYDHDPTTVCYRAVDCIEGRDFLNWLADWKKKQKPFPTILKGQDARLERNRQKVAFRDYMANLDKERVSGPTSSSIAPATAPASARAIPESDSHYEPSDEDLPF